MSSLRNHRVVIATLFLPSTTVLGESHPPTPDDHVAELPTFKSVPPSAARGLGKSGPLKSIVEDLKDKVSLVPCLLSSVILA